MPRNAIPSSPRFAFATSRAYSLLVELGISSFPVDPFAIINEFPEWRLAGYHELQFKTKEIDPLNIGKDNAEAKTQVIRGSSEYLIVYVENTGETRKRWTLAHEIGHIVLGHLIEFEETALNRRGLSKDEYGVLEVEAHWFASELLAPKSIFRRFTFENSVDEICLICDISREASEKKTNNLQNPDYGSYPEEKLLLRNFYAYLARRGYLEAIYQTSIKYFYRRSYISSWKYCRVCHRCGAYIEDENATHCHICGDQVLPPIRYTPMKKNPGRFMFGSDMFVSGKYYSEIETDKAGKVVYCPICKNHEFNDNASFCRICGNVIQNKCVLEDVALDGICRYCPTCGSETTFVSLYSKVPSDWRKNTISKIPVALNDYIEFPYWDFVLMTMANWDKNMGLYSVLDKTIMFYDGPDFAIIVGDIMSYRYINDNLNEIAKIIFDRAEYFVRRVDCYCVV